MSCHYCRVRDEPCPRSALKHAQGHGEQDDVRRRDVVATDLTRRAGASRPPNRADTLGERSSHAYRASAKRPPSLPAQCVALAAPARAQDCRPKLRRDGKEVSAAACALRELTELQRTFSRFKKGARDSIGEASSDRNEALVKIEKLLAHLESGKASEGFAVPGYCRALDELNKLRDEAINGDADVDTKLIVRRYLGHIMLIARRTR